MKPMLKWNRRTFLSLAVVGGLTTLAVVLTQQSKSGVAIEQLVLVQDELRTVSAANSSNVYLDAYGQVHAAPVDLGGNVYLDNQGQVHAAPVNLGNSHTSLFGGAQLPKPQRLE